MSLCIVAGSEEIRMILCLSGVKIRNGNMLYKKLVEGMKGRIEWRFLDYKFRAEKYIFFPSWDETYNKWGILMLPAYMRKYQIKKIVALVCDEKVAKALYCLKGMDIVIIKISQEQMTQFMSYYALIDKGKKWIVVSVTQPYETGAERLLEVQQITKKDIVYYDVYGFTNKEIDKEIDEVLEKKVERNLLAG